MLRKIKNEKGFTLLELISVIVIIGILSNVARLNIVKSNEKVNLYNAADKALADLRYVQEIAMLDRRGVCFCVIPGTNTYYAQYIDDGTYVTDARGESLDFTFNDNNYQGVTITSSETGTDLTFSSDGRPDDGSGSFNTSAIVIELNGDIEIIVLASGLTSFNIKSSSGGCGC